MIDWRAEMEYKEFISQGNDCLIYRTVSILPIGNKFAVITLTRLSGAWINNNNLGTDTVNFDTEKEATEYYDSIEY
jgi:hypothetical protein